MNALMPGAPSTRVTCQGNPGHLISSYLPHISSASCSLCACFAFQLPCFLFCRKKRKQGGRVTVNNAHLYIYIYIYIFLYIYIYTENIYIYTENIYSCHSLLPSFPCSAYYLRLPNKHSPRELIFESSGSTLFESLHSPHLHLPQAPGNPFSDEKVCAPRAGGRSIHVLLFQCCKTLLTP